METKINKIKLHLTFLAPVLLAFLFIPLYIKDGSKIGLLAISDWVIWVSFLLAPVGCLLILLREKVKDIELFSILLMFTSLILVIVSFDRVGASLYFGSVLTIVFDCFGLFFLFALLNLSHQYSTYDLVEMAMLIALAVALDLPGAKIRIGASGGSISFTMVPLVILALRQGPAKGFIGAGVIYGLITCLLDGWGLFSYPFDYLLGYGSLCVVGFFRPLIFPETPREGTKSTIVGILFLSLGVVLAVIARWLFATISGVILWETEFVASLVYNASYVLPSGGITLVSLILLYKPIQIIEKRFPKHQFIA